LVVDVKKIRIFKNVELPVPLLESLDNIDDFKTRLLSYYTAIRWSDAETKIPMVKFRDVEYTREESGTKFRGNTVEDGVATVHFKTGHIYKGEIKDNTITGRGTITYPNGDTYEGELKNSKPYGQGTLTRITVDETGRDGDAIVIYEGMFNGDKGKGRITWPDGIVQENVDFFQGERRDDFIGEEVDGGSRSKTRRKQKRKSKRYNIKIKHKSKYSRRRRRTNRK
jgi:hypothetical protein